MRLLAAALGFSMSCARAASLVRPHNWAFGVGTTTIKATLSKTFRKFSPNILEQR